MNHEIEWNADNILPYKYAKTPIDYQELKQIVINNGFIPQKY